MAPSNGRLGVYVSDLVPVALATAAAISAGWAAHTSAGDRALSRAWWWVALALALRATADGVWAWLELVRHEEPFPSLADVGYVLFYPAVLAAFWSLPSARRSTSELIRLALDAGTVVVAGAVAVWYFMLAPILSSADVWSAEVVLNVIYPVGDMLLVFALGASLVRRSDRVPLRPVQWLVAATAALLVGDLAFGHLSLTGGYDGTGWPDVAWAAGLGAFMIAALLQVQVSKLPRRVQRRRASSGVHASAAPYIGAALSCAMLLKVVYRQAWYPTLGVVIGAVTVTGLVVVRQITALRDNRHLLAAYQRLATTDPLTGLATRGHLIDRAEESFRDGDPLSVLMVDIDHFKDVNDRYGHQIGDAALRHVAGLCRASIRDSDAIVGRYGGDELVVTLFDADLTEATLVAARLHRAVVANPLFTPVGTVTLTVSIGIADRSAGPADFDELLDRADKALYKAKAAGRNRVHSAAGPTAPDRGDHAAILGATPAAHRRWSEECAPRDLNYAEVIPARAGLSSN